MDRLIAGLIGLVLGAAIGAVGSLIGDESDARVAAAHRVAAEAKERSDAAAWIALAKAGSTMAALEASKARADAADSELAQLKADIDQDLLVQLTRERVRAGEMERKFIAVQSALSTIDPAAVAAALTASVPGPPPLEITAADLYHAFDSNEIDAERQYKGRRLLVSGIVGSVGRDILGGPYVTLLASDDNLFSVQCVFDSDDGLAVLQKGQSVKVEGTCSGLAMNVLVRDCQLR